MFFYAAKLIWYLVQPSSAIAIAVTLGAILVGTGRRIWGRRLLIGGLVALFVCGLSPLSDWLIAPLEGRFRRPDLASGGPITGMIILGGAEDRADPPRELAGLNEAAERITEAVVLARRFPEARVVFTGGSAALFSTELPESATMARLLEALGVAKERLTLESQSRDTYENAAFSKRLLNPQPGQRWLLITSGWHMARAIGCFRQVGFPVEPWPVDYRTSGRFELWLNTNITDGLRQMDLIMKEYVGLVVYYLRGRTSALLPGP